MMTGQLAQALRAAREELEVPSHKVLRLVSNPEGGLQFSIDTAGPNDEVVAFDGEVLLHVSDGAKRLVGDGRVMDVKSTPSGPRLVVVNGE